MRRIGTAAGTLLALVALLSSVAAYASRSTGDLFRQGRLLYERGNVAAAANVFEKLVRRDPDVSEYHRWLGQAYGRLAQKAGWLDAISLAVKTRESFERAVQLDGDNLAALKDLRQFYQQAPAFLGGNPAKAAKLAQRVARLQAQRGPRGSLPPGTRSPG